MQPVVLEDASAGSVARIAPHLGFNCYSFQAPVGDELVDVIDAHPDFADGEQSFSGNGIPLLFPFPNRIRDGRYHWQGRDYEISPDDVGFDGAGNAIHGFCLDRPWRVTDQGPSFVVGEFQLSKDAPDRLKYWPTDCLIEVRYDLQASCLRADIRIANPSDTPLPWGFGTHPYFRLPLGAAGKPSRCTVEAPAAEEWELIDCLPTGIRKPVSSGTDLRDGVYFDQLQLDHVLTGLTYENNALECGIVDELAGLEVQQRSDSLFRELVVFTPPGRNAVCLEPYTASTDAINLQLQDKDAGLQILEPGAECRTWIEIQAGRVIA